MLHLRFRSILRARNGSRVVTRASVLILAVLLFAAPARAHSYQETRRVVCQVFTGWKCEPAMRVVKCETGGTYNPRAANWTDRHSDGSRGSFGLFQTGALHRASGESVAAFSRRMFNPWANARLAYRHANPSETLDTYSHVMPLEEIPEKTWRSVLVRSR